MTQIQLLPMTALVLHAYHSECGKLDVKSQIANNSEKLVTGY